MHDQRIDLRGTLLKPNMVLAGQEAWHPATTEQIADHTLECLYRHVPAAVPGIVLLSGGQGDEEATLRLNAMNARGPHPWLRRQPIEDLAIRVGDRERAA